MGIYSCLGKDLDEVRESLYTGRSGIVFDPARKEMGFRSALTAKLEVPDLKKELSRSQRVYMPEQAKYAYCATAQALKNAGIDQDYLDSHEVGVMYGNDSSAEPVVKAVDTMREKKDTTLVGSGAIFQSMNSTVTMNLACIFKLKGMNLTVSGACASGSHAIGLGALLIRNGLQEMVVCGGAQEVNPFSIGSFDGISAFSVREDNPAAASRPFDRDRDGLVPGGGADRGGLRGGSEAVQYGQSVIYLGGDVITGMNGRRIRGYDDYFAALYGTHEGDKVDITVFRRGSETVLEGVKLVAQTEENTRWLVR